LLIDSDAARRYLFLSLDTKIASDDPFFALCNFPALVNKAIPTMSVEQRHAYL